MTSKERDPRGIIRDHQCVRNGYYLFSAYQCCPRPFINGVPANSSVYYSHYIDEDAINKFRDLSDLLAVTGFSV